MAEPTNDDAARALERLSSPDAPTPQPKPRIVPTAKSPSGRPAAPSAKTAKAPAPMAKAPAPTRKPAPVAPPPSLQQALAESRLKPCGPKASPRCKPRTVPRGLGLKQTLIPILLTIGVILISLAIVHFAWKSDDNPVMDLPVWIIIALLAAGSLSWAVAGVNMLSVRRTLASRGENP
jgi:hypothetical protein